jgi:hypothetical protein
MSRKPSADTAIIGAGPYGLSIAAHLLARRHDVRIFGRPMSTWREQMPEGMLLKSEGFASSLSDAANEHSLPAFARRRGVEYRDTGRPIALSDYSEYGLWFQRHTVPIVETTDVVSLSRHNGAFRVGLATGESFKARRIIVAVGTTYFAYIPPELRGLDGQQITHTSQHRDLSGFRGSDVTVVGAGQSALETAALLHEHDANVRLLVRGRSLAWNPNPGPEQRGPLETLRCPPAELCGCGWRCIFHSHGAGLFHHLPLRTRLRVVCSTFGPAGAWWLRPRVEGRFDVQMQTWIQDTRNVDGRLILTLTDTTGGVREVVTDHVIAGTGYQVDVGAIRFLDRSIVAGVRRSRGLPVLSRTFESSIPGLHFVGLAAAHEFGPAMRFVHGAHFTARRLSR